MTITVVGAGIAGAACAVALREAGIAVRVLERGRAPGGRMASPELHGRRVDIGAGYFTVRDDGFRSVVDGWAQRELAREWTDTFWILTAGQDPGTTTGPMRWATPNGLRSLVRDLLADVEVVTGADVHELPEGDVVLAMPDPQAVRLTGVPDPVGYDPVIAVVCGFADRSWTLAGAGFVHDHADLEFVVDDGDRRGDGANVLVAHTNATRARSSLEDPALAISPVVAGLRDLLDVGEPDWTYSHRWTFAKPAAQHTSTFGLNAVDGRAVYLAGDQWCPHGSPRVESAWRSGTDVAGAIIARG
jgi:predicted NAD/FAD-dependent oxidoreductase